MGQRVKGSSGGVWRAKESGGGSPVRGYIHGDSARCAVTGRLDVERLAASRTIFIVASDTLLVPRFWKPEVPASTYSHLVAQSASRFPILQLLSVGPSVQTLCERERDRSGGRERESKRKREATAMSRNSPTSGGDYSRRFRRANGGVSKSSLVVRLRECRDVTTTVSASQQMDAIVPGIIVVREIFLEM